MYPNQDPWGQPQGGPQGPPAGWGQPAGFGGPQQQWAAGQAMPGAPAQQQRQPVAPPSADELMSGGFKAAQFPDQQFGTTVGGEVIADPTVTQQRDFDTNQPKFYDDGNPMWQIVVAVQAQPPTDEDDGIRAFYLSGQKKKAAQEAVRRAGASRISMGGFLWLKYVRDEPNSRGRGKDKKIFDAKYQQPAGGPAAPSNAPVSGLPTARPPRTPAPAGPPSFDDVAPF